MADQMRELTEYCRDERRPGEKRPRYRMPVSKWVSGLSKRDLDSGRRRFKLLRDSPKDTIERVIKKHSALFKVSWEGDSPCRLFCHWKGDSLLFLSGCSGKPCKPTGAYETGVRRLKETNKGEAHVCNFNL